MPIKGPAAESSGGGLGHHDQYILWKNGDFPSHVRIKYGAFGTRQFLYIDRAAVPFKYMIHSSMK